MQTFAPNLRSRKESVRRFWPSLHEKNYRFVVLPDVRVCRVNIIPASRGVDNMLVLTRIMPFINKLPGWFVLTLPREDGYLYCNPAQTRALPETHTNTHTWSRFQLPWALDCRQNIPFSSIICVFPGQWQSVSLSLCVCMCVFKFCLRVWAVLGSGTCQKASNHTFFGFYFCC